MAMAIHKSGNEDGACRLDDLCPRWHLEIPPDRRDALPLNVHIPLREIANGAVHCDDRSASQQKMARRIDRHACGWQKRAIILRHSRALGRVDTANK
jgi:hypothetical protein